MAKRRIWNFSVRRTHRVNAIVWEGRPVRADFRASRKFLVRGESFRVYRSLGKQYFLRERPNLIPPRPLSLLALVTTLFTRRISVPLARRYSLEKKLESCSGIFSCAIYGKSWTVGQAVSFHHGFEDSLSFSMPTDWSPTTLCLSIVQYSFFNFANLSQGE